MTVIKLLYITSKPFYMLIFDTGAGTLENTGFLCHKRMIPVKSYQLELQRETGRQEGDRTMFLPSCLLACFYEDAPAMSLHSRSSRFQFPASSSPPDIVPVHPCRCINTIQALSLSSTVLLPASSFQSLRALPLSPPNFWGLWLLTAGFLVGLLSPPITVYLIPYIKFPLLK